MRSFIFHQHPLSNVNVLYYLDWFPKISQSFILNEIHYISQQGHNVAVFALNEPDTDVEHAELNEIDIDVKYADPVSVHSVSKSLFGSVFDGRTSGEWDLTDPKRCFGIRFLMKQCVEFIDTLEYDLDHIHAHFLRWNKIPAARIAEELGVSSSLTTHAYDLYASRDEETLRTTCDAFNTILTISEYNRHFLDVEVNPDADIEVIKMGIRMEKFEPRTDDTDPHLLTISRFVEKKGIEYALHAVARCIDDHPELNYRLIGSGPRHDQYERIIDRLGIRNNVTFLGSVSDEQLIRELDRARAFLLPCVVAKDGDRDGIPVAIMEAMAMETPAVSTYVSGIPELIENGKNGYVCPSRSITDLAFAIRDCLSDTNDLSGVRETIQKNHDIDLIGEKLLSFFNENRSDSIHQ